MKPLTLVLLFLAFIACHRKAERRFCDDYDNTYVSLRIFKDSNNVAASYIRFFGFNGARVFDYIRIDTLNSSKVDSIFALSLNVNSDTSQFGLVRADLSVDTINISYIRKFGISRPYKVNGSCYLCDISNLKLDRVSGRLKVDTVRAGFYYRGAAYIDLRQK